MNRADPYAEIARFYDAEFASATADVRTFFQDLEGCRRVLVLGCGTGRVSEGLRCPGREIVGVDISQPMIERARAIGVGGEPTPVTYVVGDMCALPDLGGFDAAVVPNAAFSFLPTRRAQLQCLQGLRARVDGPVWIDVPMPDFTLLGQGHTPEAVAARHDGDEGGGWTRTREVFRFPVEQRLLLRDRYYVNFDADGAWQGAVPDHVSDLALRLIFPAELEWMLETAGFYADRLYGDHAGSPVREGCDRLLVRAL